MSKTIEFTYNDVAYTLEFTRATVVQMEKKGFKIQEASELPVSTIPTLFAGAFLAHHGKTSKATIDEIYTAITDKASLVEKLVLMYADVINTLLDEPDDTAKKVKWEANW